MAEDDAFDVLVGQESSQEVEVARCALQHQPRLKPHDAHQGARMIGVGTYSPRRSTRQAMRLLLRNV